MKLAKSIYSFILQVIDYFLLGLWVIVNTFKKQNVYIISMPGDYHITLRSIKKCEANNLSVNIILNGVDVDEYRFIRTQINANYKRTLFQRRHHNLLNVIIFFSSGVVMLIDHDCFLHNESTITKMNDIAQTRLGSAYFGTNRENQNRPNFETFLLAINSKYFRRILFDYRVTARPTTIDKLNKKTRQFLVDSGQLNYPESHKNYFDTLRLTNQIALSMNRNIDIQIIECFDNKEIASDQNASHIGGISNLKEEDLYATRGYYFWHRSFCSSNTKLLAATRKSRLPCESISTQKERLDSHTLHTIDSILEMTN